MVRADGDLRARSRAATRAAQDEGVGGRPAVGGSGRLRDHQDRRWRRLGRVRAGLLRGGDGRRPRRLVRRHRTVPPPTRHPDSAHGDHPQAQGPDRPQPRRVRRGQLPHPRGARASGWRRPTSATGSASGCRNRPTPIAPARRSATLCEAASRCSTTRRSSTALEGVVRHRIRSTPAAPLVGKVIDLSVDGGHHQRLLDTVLIGLGGFLDDNRVTFRQRLEEESPWWVPEPIDDRIFDKIYTAVGSFLTDVGGDPTPRDPALGRHPRAGVRRAGSNPTPNCWPRVRNSRTSCSTTPSSEHGSSRSGSAPSRA